MHDLAAIIRNPERLSLLQRAVQSPETACPPLVSAKIKLTQRCNLRCAMCKYWRARPGDELAAGEVLRAIGEMRQMGLTKVHFSGGEIFTRPDVAPILSETAALGIQVNLTTNGTLIDQEAARALVRARVHSISVSLDGPNAKRHDRIRGQEGAFQAAVRGIRLIGKERRKHGRRLHIRINTCLQKRNYLAQPDMVDLAARLGAVELHPMPVDGKPKGRKVGLSREQIREYNEAVAPEVAARRALNGFSTHADFVYPFGRTEEEIAESARGNYARGFYRRQACFAPWLHTFVDWAGNVFPCCMARGHTAPLGNVRRESMPEIFGGEAYKALRRRFLAERPAVCGRCDDFLAENRLLNSRVQVD